MAAATVGRMAKRKGRMDEGEDASHSAAALPFKRTRFGGAAAQDWSANLGTPTGPSAPWPSSPPSPAAAAPYATASPPPQQQLPLFTASPPTAGPSWPAGSAGGQQQQQQQPWGAPAAPTLQQPVLANAGSPPLGPQQAQPASQQQQQQHIGVRRPAPEAWSPPSKAQEHHDPGKAGGESEDEELEEVVNDQTLQPAWQRLRMGQEGYRLVIPPHLTAIPQSVLNPTAGPAELPPGLEKRGSADMMAVVPYNPAQQALAQEAYWKALGQHGLPAALQARLQPSALRFDNQRRLPEAGEGPRGVMFEELPDSGGAMEGQGAAGADSGMSSEDLPQAMEE